MRKLARSSVTTILGATFALLLPAAPAEAAPRTWVSSTGSGALCSRAAPCATFAAAHTATDPGGEINCVDAGDYGIVTITKAISIVCDNTEAGIVTSASGIGVFITAGPTDIVTLKGLDIEGGGIGSAGIVFSSGRPCTSTRSRSGISVGAAAPVSPSNRPPTPSYTWRTATSPIMGLLRCRPAAES